MMCLECGENHNPNSGRQTPISQRRPLQRINLNAAVLSPTKRRKQTHADEQTAQAVEPLKIVALRDEAFAGSPGGSPGKADRHRTNVLLEIFSRLCVRDLVGDAAPACRLWHEVAHSKELWGLLRRHLRLVDQLLISEKVVERRSKGRLFRCKRLGTGEAVLLRVVDLELTNAGKDDGVPTSFLREAALLSKLRHPNVIRHMGSEILGKRAVMCTEFVHESFTTWYKRLETKASCERLTEIKQKFHQVLTGLSYVHHQGVMHRNLKPDNIFMDVHGTVKLGDFTTTRMLDIPFQAYTPEDPKERDRSGREMRRLWYRAPELILRDEIYGPKVDTWSVGCLLAEAATGRPLFQSDSEIDHLFRVFRLVGTPTAASWPEVLTMKNFSPKFPIYPGFSLAQVAHAVCLGSTADQDELLAQAQPDRVDILQNLLSVAAMLGADGMLVLDCLVTVPPAIRAGADATLESTFFSGGHQLQPLESSGRGGGRGSGSELHPMVLLWLQGKLPSHAEASAETPRQHAAFCPALEELPSKYMRELEFCTPRIKLSFEDVATDDGPEGCPPVAVPSSLIPAHVVWSILNVRRSQERRPNGLVENGCGDASPCAAPGQGDEGALPRLPPGFDPGQRARLIDFIIGLASTLSLTDYTLHLAAAVLDRYLALQEEPLAQDRVQVVAATCLKVADVFAEQSKEYYKQENASEYAEATFHQAMPEQMLQCEKDVLPKLEFDLHLPTAHWFVHCYLAYGRFTQAGSVAKTAAFIGDLTLLDHELLAYPPSLRAQCALILAVFLVQQAQSEKRKPGSAAPDGAAHGGSRASQEPFGSPAAPSPTGSPRGSPTAASQGGDSAVGPLLLTYLEHWDREVRNHV